MALPVYQRETSSFARVLGFLDAIYGFAVTLLVVNLDATSPEAWRSIDAFIARGMGSQFLGFAISFVVIVAFWRRNLAIMATFTGLDPPVITCNILVVGLITVIPFTTQGMSDPHTAELPLPTAFYAVNITLALIVPVVFLSSIPVAYLTDGETAKLCWLALFLLDPLGARLVRRVDASSKDQSARIEVSP